MAQGPEAIQNSTTDEEEGAPRPFYIHGLAIQPDPWETIEDAAEYLAGDFAGLLEALEDFRAAGVRPPDHLCFSLAQVVKAAAGIVEDGRPRRFEADPCSETVTDFARAIDELTEKAGPTMSFKNVDGRGAELSADGLPALANALEQAAAVYADDRREADSRAMEARRIEMGPVEQAELSWLRRMNQESPGADAGETFRLLSEVPPGELLSMLRARRSANGSAQL